MPAEIAERKEARNELHCYSTCRFWASVCPECRFNSRTVIRFCEARGKNGIAGPLRTFIRRYCGNHAHADPLTRGLLGKLEKLGAASLSGGSLLDFLRLVDGLQSSPAREV